MVERLSPRERALAGVVERAARSPHAAKLVLRGGLVLRELVAPSPRPVDDVDFLGLGCFDAQTIEPVLVELLASDAGDGVRYGAASFATTWVETEHPGVRAACVAVVDGDEQRAIEIQVDVGFGDPRVVDDVAFTLPGTQTSMAAAAAETLLAWKVHGLFERGRGQWRPKDLCDVVALGSKPGLDHDMLPECLRVAFASHGHELSLMDRFLHGEWGQSRGSRRKWRSFVRRRGDGSLPQELDAVVASARDIVTRVLGASATVRT